MPPWASISSRNGPFLRLERISLLSPQMSLFVQPVNCRPRCPSNSLGWSSGCSSRGSSTCSIVLERENQIADLVCLAVPHQLDLALVLEEKEPVLLRQRLIGLDVSPIAPAARIPLTLIALFQPCAPRLTPANARSSHPTGIMTNVAIDAVPWRIMGIFSPLRH